ncbi:hypothetical protein PVK62_11460 [Aliivibrio sp. S3MY1]|uniref:hypothetical protein n=1 Tax=unclassified Aliivibrio TaxID=2645654 RepID=UPI0023781686|nr:MULTISPECIES: hypothetical protein [unclassified Aliivibrio]MDD9196449.1 hypothetical protein [Aliivibrio sp. S3MY1]MDD9200655.1 hypothetical protein [Aliivibrio sp. S2MY1]
MIAAPKFLNLQDDTHESRTDGVFSAFTAFTAAVSMYHCAWVLQGEPSASSGVGVIFSDETIYPSNMDDNTNKGYIMRYSVTTGETVVEFTKFPK